MRHFQKKLLSLLIAFLIVLLPFSCSEVSDSSSETLQSVNPLEGVWNLTNHYVLANEDTIWSMDSVRRVQHKIYLDGYVMWTSDPAEDSSEWHGFGPYRQSGDTIFEKLEVMSYPMKQAMGEFEEAVLLVEYDENNFKQVIENLWNDTIWQQIEVYKKKN